MNNESKKTRKIVSVALLSSFAIVLAYVSHYIYIIPGISMLKADFSNIPIFICTLGFGPFCGFLSLFVLAFIRMLFFSAAGIPGFIMRFMTYSIEIFFLGLYRKKAIMQLKTSMNPWKFFVLSVALSTILKSILNYFFWTRFFAMSEPWVCSIIISIFIPVHVIKTLLELYSSLFIYKKISKFMCQEIF